MLSEDVAPGFEGLWSKGSATKPALSQSTFGGVVALGSPLCALFFCLGPNATAVPQVRAPPAQGGGNWLSPLSSPTSSKAYCLTDPFFV